MSKDTMTDVEMPIERDVNFFVRIKGVNADFLKSEAAKASRGKRPNVSKWFDAFCDKLRGPKK